MRRALAVLALLIAAALAPARAANYCVSNSGELLDALQATAASAADDTIRIQQGSYSIDGSIGWPQNGSLRLLGGYGPNCLLRPGYLNDTVISAPTPGSPRTIELHLPLDGGDNQVERLTFRNFSRVRISDKGESGSLLVNQNLFEGNDTGLALSIRALDLVVENNLFLDNRSGCCAGTFINRGLLILRDTPAQSISLDVRFNTVTRSNVGLDIRGNGPWSTPPRLQNNILWDNLAFDLALDELDVVATNNVWDSEHLEHGAGFSLFGLHLDVDPLLSSNGRPQAPDSPAINSGTDFVVGGVSARDADGQPRHVGSRPDRGALESSLNDITDLVVTTTANSGAGSLRQAILDANNTLDGATISFNIPGGCPQLIVPTSDLPAITKPVVIDGFTQPGSSPGSSTVEYDAVHCIGLLGGGARQDGLRLATAAEADRMTVRGLSLYGFTRYGIHVSGPGAAQISGNTFGTGVAVVVLQNTFGDAAIRVDDAPGTVIGGLQPADRNVIGRATGAGIRVDGGSLTDIRGNFIGVGMDGSSDLGNGTGVLFIGGSQRYLYRNVIGHSDGAGVRLQGDHYSHYFYGNHIGVTPAGANIGNATNGIRVTEGENALFVDNEIAYNGTDGIAITSTATRIALVRNLIHHNGNLGVDVHPDGVNPEDTDTGASGANRSQNAPELLLAEGGAGGGRVTGELRSSNGEFHIWLFASDACDGSGFGEGQYLASAEHIVVIDNGTTTDDGVVGFEIQATAGNGLDSLWGKAITAMAIYQDQTSEFSACIPYIPGDSLFGDGFE